MISDSEQLIPGVWLRQARERCGLSIVDVAQQLNLLKGQVVALEENRFERLPGAVYTVGYLRNYSRLVGLSADDVLGAYYDRKGRPAPVSLQVPPVARQASRFQHRQQHSYMGVAVAAAIVAGVWLIGGDDRGTPLPDDLAQSIQVDTAIGTTVIESLEQLPEDDPTRDIVPEVQWIEPEQPATASDVATVAAPVSQLVAANDGAAQIRFRFSADCWIEVRNGDSHVIYSSMKRADDVLELSGKPPFKVTLGYAPGVSVSYNGEPVTIPYGSGNVAKIVLGES